MFNKLLQKFLHIIGINYLTKEDKFTAQRDFEDQLRQEAELEARYDVERFREVVNNNE